ncbi:phosphate signaling complex protein PhoU [Undibacterium fentianense]|uniref:Phosphate-specific transport system accessory protein PhoU n=1 Tax=Undibacterium fentianense TaxID=2828728 RepID=A0A941E1L6_9BURK|nr:phosphate signaling complex protein PhoU [Undibacterium fentianense]MBR7799392.1 phosphate signaling complex protein PhoU [Undibacterium fentianense]
MTGEHSSSQYNHDLEAIRSQVLLMGGLVENHFQDAMNCYRTGNSEHAAAVVKSDEEVNRLEVMLDDMCSHLIVKRQPAANDLRTVMATGKVITDLERIGDESTKIARIAQEMASKNRTNAMFSGYETVRVLANSVGQMLHQSLDAFARHDDAKAVQLIAFDEIIDSDFRSIMRNLITFMMEDPATISFALDALWVAKAIERIGDHAKNIAEHTIYIVEGRDIRHSDYVATKQDKQHQGE